MAIIIQLLIGLKPLERIDGIVPPLTIYFAFEITFVGQRLLNLLVSVRLGAKLIGGRRRLMSYDAHQFAAPVPHIANASCFGRARS
jgi:hypothetical protein